MNADLLGSMWSVAPVSATTRDMRLEDAPWVCGIDHAGGLASRVRTVFGR